MSAGLSLFIVPGREVRNKPNSEAEDIVSSSEELVEYLTNLRGLEMSGEVNRQIRLVEEALAGNYMRDVFTLKWGR